MTVQFLIIVIIVIISAIMAIFTIDVLRRAYMSKRYALLDRARLEYFPLVEALTRGEITDLSVFKKKPDSLEWLAIEELLFKALEEAGPDPPASGGRVAWRAKIKGVFFTLGYVDEYLKRVKRGRHWKMASAIDNLGRIPVQESAFLLQESLKSRHFDARNMAANSLGLIQAQSSIIPLIESLKDTVLGGPKRVSIRVVKSALIGFGNAAVPFLIKEAKNADWRIRAQIIDIIAEIGSLECEGSLIEALTDHEADIRAKAAKGLGKISSRLALRHLPKLVDDVSWVVRLQAIRALGQIRDPYAVEDIKKGITDSNWQVRSAAAAALGKMGPNAVFLLSDILLHNNDGFAREQVIEEIQRSGIVNSIINGLIDKDENIRNTAEDMLRAMAANRALAPLISALKHKDPLIREKAAAILADFLKEGV